MIILHIIIPILVLVGLWLMSRVPTAVKGNILSILSMVLAIFVAMWSTSLTAAIIVCAFLIIGGVIGWIMANKVKMIQMPQMVGLLNGLGGGASMLVGILSLIGVKNPNIIAESMGNHLGEMLLGEATSGSVFWVNPFEATTAVLAIIIGALTLSGSLVAAGKLHRVLPQKPIHLKGHNIYINITLLMCLAAIILVLAYFRTNTIAWIALLATVGGLAFGIYFTLRVGGADMPITISLLNSLSGVAGGIAGMAIGNLMLVAIGGIVGASGLLLTQIMCRAMNRNLVDILLGKTATPSKKAAPAAKTTNDAPEVAKGSANQAPKGEKEEPIATAKDVIIVPGYGMALAQAQQQVKQLADTFVRNGAKVRYAIHPVAGRMPGHMNVLLAEANVDYDDLKEMAQINDDFKNADLVVVIGANDVLNPAAREAEGTPIYGMPVLNVDQAKHVIICNYDLNPGYAGVPNPLYEDKKKVTMMLGDAKESLQKLIDEVAHAKSEPAVATASAESAPKAYDIKSAKDVIIVPGYGMALAQAQQQVKQLADTFVRNGAKVRYAIHPVAGRMPGHMNVLLAEANVDYDDLKEMAQINDDFKNADLVVVIGANDVLNPAAREAEGTPIYGMPVLNVDQAKHVIICNYDLKPGYAGVPNPLYENKEKVTMMLGDAKESLNKLIAEVSRPRTESAGPATTPTQSPIATAKDVIIVPGYGMALAQAQQQVKQLADTFVRNGAKVRYAIHPVAGRMPGHMNVLLAEANVDYDDLKEMAQINDDFKNADLVVVIGANDVLNPAAREAEGTPIYGMPVLNVDQAKHVIICNYDLKPGYAGVPNPLYENKEKVTMMLGDAKESLNKLIAEVSRPRTESAGPATTPTQSPIATAKDVIIVPGYGMALAQAQQQVKQLADTFVRNGAKVRYAIHPVAGRMPGHMNVLLAEANVDYDDLKEMAQINDDFKNADLVVVIGANDVLNPAAREAEGTPIYGMPVLNVDQAKHVIICNYDLNPGYAGVPNPLYEDKEKVTMMLGDAKESLQKLIDEVAHAKSEPAVATASAESAPKAYDIKSAKDVIIVPGYGMALAQAQQQVKQLADAFARNGAKVRYAIHPVAGRMPGHMNVLLAEANVDYDDLKEMAQINDDFKNADLVVVIGANDVLNPAAREAEGTPIYGMPVLNVDQAKHVIICNYDLNPGYAGVPNPLYEDKEKVTMMLGDAKESLQTLLDQLM